MQVNSIQNTALTNTFKDFRMPDIKTAQNTNLLNTAPVPVEFHNEESHKYEKGGLKKAVPFIDKDTIPSLALLFNGSFIQTLKGKTGYFDILIKTHKVKKLP